MISKLDRVRGCLLGGAIGDALGAPVEFRSAAAIEQQGGVLNSYFLGAITDDTQMTLFTLEGLLRARVASSDPLDAIHAAYLRWYRTQTEGMPDAFETDDGWLIQHKPLWSRRAPGLTCMSALASLAAGRKADNDSKGCGGVMRVAPIGLAKNEPFELAAAAAELTHGHATSSAASGAFALLIARLALGEASLDTAIEDMIAKLSASAGTEETLEVVGLARRLAVTYTGKGIPLALGPDGNGAGWIAEEALAVAVYACLRERDPIRALALAVEHDGDSDSTGAIAGNILGATLGADWLPEDWLSRLELRDVIERMAADLVAVEGGGVSKEIASRYPG